MPIPLEAPKTVIIRTEAYASVISIRANPEDAAAGSVTLEMHRLEYHDDVLHRVEPMSPLGETIGDFAARTFTVGTKTITGLEVVQLIKQYVETRHAESVAPPPAPPAP